jgi:DNA-binding IscR family transcriptional regulator
MLRTILRLASNRNGKRVAISQVAKPQKIPSSVLAKIISQLSIAGLLHKEIGRENGYELWWLPSIRTIQNCILC